MQRFVITDIHGYYLALLQCMERSRFDMEKDLLICLGDTCDRGPQTCESFEELLKIKNLLYILGNHDLCFREHIESQGDNPEPLWTRQGGRSTLKSYPAGIPASHIKLLSEALLYLVIDNMLFVHAGLDPNKAIESNSTHDLLWNRNLIEQAYQGRGIGNKLTPYTKVFAGHTPTTQKNFNSLKPLIFNEFRLLDTGVIHGKHLSIMNIDTDEYFQSNLVSDLYPDWVFCSNK